MPPGRTGRRARRAPTRPSAQAERRLPRRTGVQRTEPLAGQFRSSRSIRSGRAPGWSEPVAPHMRISADTTARTANPTGRLKGAWRTMRKLAVLLLAAAALAALVAALTSRGGSPATAQASSHREAPLISEDPSADNTDTYAFRIPDAPDTVTIISN